MVIFHHGSPTPAIEAAEKVFEQKYPGTKVLREKDDALPNMRKVTDLGKLADLVYTDDYSIIPPVMFPKYADFWIRYAHDEMTIAYAANSKYANEINGDNWYKILQRPDVKWGIADPNAGPRRLFLARPDHVVEHLLQGQQHFQESDRRQHRYPGHRIRRALHGGLPGEPEPEVCAE